MMMSPVPEAELAVLRHRMRAITANIEQGLRDLRACQLTIEALERRALSDRQAEARDADLPDGPVVADELHEVFDLVSRGQALLLAHMIERAGRPFSLTVISGLLDCTRTRARSEVYGLRDRMRRAGFDRAVLSCVGAGYMVPEEAAERIRDHVVAYKRTFIISGPDEAANLYDEPAQPAPSRRRGGQGEQRHAA